MPAGASETKSIVAIARSRVPGNTRKGERGERRRVSGVIRRCGRSPIKHLDWPRMGLGNAWSRALVYFGIVEEEEYWDDEAYEAEQDLERTYSDRPNVRRLHSRRREPEFDDWSDPGPQGARTAVLRPPTGRRANLEAVASAAVKVHLILPRSFNDAQSIADKFKDLVPVIINLQGADTELSKRLIDFSSGLTYALDGSMQRVADKVFLLTPRNVEVSAEERARLIDRGFFNQA